MHPSQWKLFREMFIHLNITTLGDIVTACGKFITKEAYNENKSYDSVHKWPQQQHSILLAHRELWSQCRCGITQQRSRLLLQPLGAWTTAPTTVQPYRMASDKLLVQQQDGSWIQHDQCIHQLPLRSPETHFEELTGRHIELPRAHTMVDIQRWGTTLVAEHNNLPEIKLPQRINEAMITIRPSIR